MKGLSVLVLAALVACACALPVSQSSPWVRSGKYQGDILLHPSQLDKNGMKDSRYYWPNATMYYNISPSFSVFQKDAVLGAVNVLHALTTVRLVERTNQANYVAIGDSEEGCFSNIGMVGGAQTLNLGVGCYEQGTILHEMLHALGFWHQQSATNRDDYVRIMWGNIIPKEKKNFDEQNKKTVTDFGIEYDYGSLMHYGAYDFTKNGKPTIVPHDANATIGQNVGLSRKDIQKLELMYKSGASRRTMQLWPSLTQRFSSSVQCLVIFILFSIMK